MKGLYIHIPFCISKCPYCDFNSYSGKFQLATPYIKSVVDELKTYENDSICSVYIGGGTPTCIDETHIVYLMDEIKKHFTIEENAEVTIEANPATIKPEKLKTYLKSGINRISIGVQSFQNEILRTLGRIHSSSQAKEAVVFAKNAGFDNISIDLMFSLPGQSVALWQQDLEIAANMNITHISCYGLKIEEGTQFFNSGVSPADEDLDREMYHTAIDILGRNGFEQYEISNFARNNLYSKHNLLYWHCNEYIGIGAGAHSYINRKRYANLRDINEYIHGIGTHEELQILNRHDMDIEKLIMGMRLTEGVDLSLIEHLNQVPKVTEYIKNGFIECKNNKISFTTKGFDVSNYILSELI